MGTGFVDPEHNHDKCLSTAIAQAEQRCEAQGKRMTEGRRRVLEIVWSNHEPVSAYQIMDRLRDEGHKVQPPTVYRALEFFTELNLIHRIESLNAYLGCSGGEGENETTEFYICKQCKRVTERLGPEVTGSLERTAAEMNFQIERSVIEIVGICPHCADAAH